MMIIMNMSSKQQYFNDQYRFIKSHVGQWHMGQDVVMRGRSLLRELLPEMSSMQLLVFATTGKCIDQNLATWMEKTRFLSAYPDSRIWCNQIASIVSSQGISPVTAGTLSFLAADSKAYGSLVQKHIVFAIEQLYRAYQQCNDFEMLVEQFPKRGSERVIPGFLRPVQVYDERLEPMRELTEKLGFEPGPHLQFAEAFSRYLEKNCQLGINVAGFGCAFLLDHDFTAEQIYLLSISSVEIGALACYKEFKDRPENGFLPLKCGDVEYQGPARRDVPHNSNLRTVDKAV